MYCMRRRKTQGNEVCNQAKPSIISIRSNGIISTGVNVSQVRSICLTSLALLAFAGNSLLCRAALRHTPIDAASFTTIRLLSGALVLGVLVRSTSRARARHGNWKAALSLFAYAACFSFAYTSLPASVGALLLFGTVQVTMIGWGLYNGERLRPWQIAGLALAFSGLLGLLWPGLSAPPLPGTLLMIVSGMAWGIYSLLGKGAGDPLQVTAGNFARAALPTLVLSALCFGQMHIDKQGAMFALASGALTSGLGYAVWYAVLPQLKASQAATAQLSVPVIAAFAAVPLLGEVWGQRLVLAAMAVLGGIALVIHPRSAAIPSRVPHDH
jgi:drug/metabolite transporter (DMT)-like permease